MKLLQENPEERKAFDAAVESCFQGDVIGHIGASLQVMVGELPKGTFADLLAIYSNELVKISEAKVAEMSKCDIGTGKTTGLMLKALGEAVMAKGAEVEFVDHVIPAASFAREVAEKHAFAFGNMAVQLDLSVDTRWTQDGRVFVRSTFGKNNG